jgi:hypothetical protein
LLVPASASRRSFRFARWALLAGLHLDLLLILVLLANLLLRSAGTSSLSLASALSYQVGGCTEQDRQQYSRKASGRID